MFCMALDTHRFKHDVTDAARSALEELYVLLDTFYMYMFTGSLVSNQRDIP